LGGARWVRRSLTASSSTGAPAPTCGSGCGSLRDRRLDRASPAHLDRAVRAHDLRRMSEDPRQYAPSTARNLAPIWTVLQRHLPGRGLVLEVASGSGEHAVHFAQAAGPEIIFQPSDPDTGARASTRGPPRQACRTSARRSPSCKGPRGFFRGRSLPLRVPSLGKGVTRAEQQTSIATYVRNRLGRARSRRSRRWPWTAAPPAIGRCRRTTYPSSFAGRGDRASPRSCRSCRLG
jgi:hypothetical protein